MVNFKQNFCTEEDILKTTASVESFTKEVMCGVNFLASGIQISLSKEYPISSKSYLYVDFIPTYENIAWMNTALMASAVKLKISKHGSVNINELLRETFSSITADEAWKLILPAWRVSLISTEDPIINRIRMRRLDQELLETLYIVPKTFEFSTEKRSALLHYPEKTWSSEIAKNIKKRVSRLVRTGRENVDKYISAQGYTRPAMLNSLHLDLMKVASGNEQPTVPPLRDTTFDLMLRMNDITPAVESIEGVIEVLSLNEFVVKGVPLKNQLMIAAFSTMQIQRTFPPQAHLRKHRVISSHLAVKSLMTYLRKSRNKIYHMSLDRNLDEVARALVAVGTVNG